MAAAVALAIGMGRMALSPMLYLWLELPERLCGAIEELGEGPQAVSSEVLSKLKSKSDADFFDMG